MQSIYKILFLVLIIVLVNSCGKGHGGDCFKGTGEVVKESRVAGKIDRIILDDIVNLILKQDSVESIVVEAGSKLIKAVKTELNNGELSIDNTNTCNWVRSFKNEITVYVSVKDLKNIYYLGSGDISSVNTLESEQFEIEVYDGAGSVDLTINTVSSWIVVHLGVADISVKGVSGINYLYYAGHGPIDCVNLETEITYITSLGSNNCFINVKDLLDANIGSVGDVYYKGDPSTIENKISGSGQLISID